jgi:hypothetical protein
MAASVRRFQASEPTQSSHIRASGCTGLCGGARGVREAGQRLRRTLIHRGPRHLSDPVVGQHGSAHVHRPRDGRSSANADVKGGAGYTGLRSAHALDGPSTLRPAEQAQPRCKLEARALQRVGLSGAAGRRSARCGNPLQRGELLLSARGSLSLQRTPRKSFAESAPSEATCACSSTANRSTSQVMSSTCAFASESCARSSSS